MATYQGLVDRYGRPIEKSVLTTEVAGPTLTGVRSHLTGYPGDGLNPVRLANILREADAGDPLRYLELAETIEERDLHYVGVLGTRKRSVSQLDITVDAASDDALHVEQADMIRDWLDRDELADDIFNILDAIGKGVSFTEILWSTSSLQWMPERLEWRDPRWFTFAREDGSTPRLRTDEGDAPLPGGKFIMATMRAKSGLPIRSGIARIVAWAWMFKAFTSRDWAIFTQTYGQPIRLGKFHANASKEEKATLFRAVANIAGDCAAIIPESMDIEFVESKSVSASTDLYKVRSDWLDQQVSKAVLGQTATTDAIAGGHAVGQEHRQVQEDIERADARALAAILNRDLVRVWIDLEYGPQKRYPRLRIGRAEQTDVKMVVDAVTRLVPLGLRVQASEITDMLGLSDPDEGAVLLRPPGTPAAIADDSAPPALQAAASRPRDTVDALARRTERLAAPALDALIDTVRQLVDTAHTLEDVRNGLLALMPDMPEADLAAAMRQALALAELTGRDELNG